MDTNRQSQISKVIRLFLAHRFSPSTEEKVQRWLIQDADAEEKEQASLEYWNELEVLPNAATCRSLRKVNQQIKPKVETFYRLLLRVAAVLVPIFMVSGSYLYYRHAQQEQWMVAATNYGETMQIVLPDQSEVWLNSGTTLHYPQKFKNNTRSIRLEGEAYFSVTKDVTKPFIVQTEQLSVTVLGTEFNVKAYPDDEKTITTLNTGKIEVQTNTHQSRILHPNEQLVYDRQTSDLTVSTVSANDISAWTGGQLIFSNSSLEEILQTLERRFNVRFELDENVPLQTNYTVKFLKNDSLEQILNILGEMNSHFSYQKEQGTYKIKLNN